MEVQRWNVVKKHVKNPKLTGSNKKQGQVACFFVLFKCVETVSYNVKVKFSNLCKLKRLCFSKWKCYTWSMVVVVFA